MKKLNDVAKEVVKSQDEVKKAPKVEVEVKSCPECGCSCKVESDPEDEPSLKA